MLICAIRTVLIYALVMLSVRIMGKRQISELRPSELVAALLISDLAAVPMQETGTPLLYGIVPICILVALELILSGVMLKFPAVSRLLSGNPVPVIVDGKPDVAALKKLRLTVEDLMEAMRMQNVFCFDEVAYAVVERGGCVTLYPRPAAKPVTCGDVGAVGVPVFAGFSGGVQKFAGPTGGYLVGYLLCAFLAGLFIRRHAEKPLFWIVGFVVGTAALYAFGTAWFMIGSKTPLGAALLTCVVPFLAGDAVKIAAAIAVGFPLRKTLSRHHYI